MCEAQGKKLIKMQFNFNGGMILCMYRHSRHITTITIDTTLGMMSEFFIQFQIKTIIQAPLVFNLLPCNCDHNLNRINAKFFSFNPMHDHSWKDSSPSFQFHHRRSLSISVSYAFLQSSLQRLYLLFPQKHKHIGCIQAPLNIQVPANHQI